MENINIVIDKEILQNIDIDIDEEILQNIDIDIDEEILQNIDIDIDEEILHNINIDIDKEILQNINIDKISFLSILYFVLKFFLSLSLSYDLCSKIKNQFQGQPLICFSKDNFFDTIFTEDFSSAASSP